MKPFGSKAAQPVPNTIPWVIEQVQKWKSDNPKFDRTVSEPNLNTLRVTLDLDQMSSASLKELSEIIKDPTAPFISLTINCWDSKNKQPLFLQERLFVSGHPSASLLIHTLIFEHFVAAKATIDNIQIGLTDHPSITCLGFMSTTITPPIATMIQKVLSKQSITTINFASHSGIKAPQIESIYFNGYRHLNRSDAKFTFEKDAFDILINALQTGTPYELYLIEMGVTGAQAARLLSAPAKIVKLNLSGNNLWDNFQEISHALEENNSVKHLSLKETGLDLLAAKALAIACKKNTTLQGLDVAANEITEEGVQVLIEMAQQKKSGI